VLQPIIEANAKSVTEEAIKTEAPFIPKTSENARLTASEPESSIISDEGFL
jgi:hypothetical protein